MRKEPRKRKQFCDDYPTKADLADKIDWEGGLAEFVIGYNVGGNGLPEPLCSAAEELFLAYQRCSQVFEDAGVIV